MPRIIGELTDKKCSLGSLWHPANFFEVASLPIVGEHAPEIFFGGLRQTPIFLNCACVHPTIWQLGGFYRYSTVSIPFSVRIGHVVCAILL